MDKRYLTLLFTTPKKTNIFSSIIKWRLGTKYSHVCGVVSTGPIGLFDLYQASNGDVNAIELENFLEKNKVIQTCRICFDDKNDYYTLIRFLKKQLGKSYSMMGAIASTFPSLRFLGFGKDGDSEFMCSEYMARGLEMTEILNIDDYKKGRGSADYVDPKFFETMLINAGFDIYMGLHFPEKEVM